MNIMSRTTSGIVTLLEQIAREVLTQLEGIAPADLNRALTLPESNTLFALATHFIGSGEFWTLVAVGGREIPRDRSAEFHATGRVEDLRPRYERWVMGLHEVLDEFPDARLDEQADLQGRSTTPRTKREALLHAVEHSALHLGHIQLTRQFLGYAPPPED